MPQTLFDDQAKRRSDAKRGEKIVYEDATKRATADTYAEQRGPGHIYTGASVDISQTAFRRMWEALTGTRKRYYDLLRKVWTKGYQTQSGDVIHTLTDREAAAFLSVERTTINGRRNELQGGSGGDAFEPHPLVEKGNGGERRSCHVRPGGPDVYCFKPRLDVYSVGEEYR